MDVKEVLREARDELMSTLNTYLSVKAMTEDVDGMKDFIKYINRYTASEVQFLIEKHGFKNELEPIIEKIEEKIRTSCQKARNDKCGTT